MYLTRHADLRRVQRSLPIDVLSTIYAYGSASHSKGAMSVTLDGQSIALAAEGDRRMRATLERYRGSYIVIGDGEKVVTAARRCRRFRR